MNKSLTYILLFFVLNSFSQKEANFWYFGENVGLNFAFNPPKVISGALSTDEGSASISNADGVLQFYTDGSTVFDKNGGVMINGTGLLGNSSSAQSAIIVPKPLNSNIYYIFTVGNQTGGGGNGVAFSEVDMSLNNGLGEIIQKNTPLVGSENAREKITSVRGEDCNTFWVITSDNNSFYAYLIDENGVNNGVNDGIIESPKQSDHNNGLFNLRGYLKISPDGKTLVNASAASGTFIFDFNAKNGDITNGGEISAVNNGYGVEFSRNSKKLYISSGVHSQVNNGNRNPAQYADISQLSLESRDIRAINNSAKIIYFTSQGYRGALQLASNGKIYYARSRQTSIGVISSPEKDFTDITNNEVEFEEKGLSLDGGISTEGLPPFIQSFFLEVEITDSDTNISLNNQDLDFCTGQDKTIISQDITGINKTYSWTYDDGSGPNEISDVQNLILTDLKTTDSGKYSLKIELTDDCGNVTQYNGTFNIDVYDAATATKPADIIFCDTDRDGFNSFEFQNDNTLKDKILTGLDASKFEIVYFKTIDDANSGDNPLPNSYTNPTAFSSETIYARVQNTGAPNACFAITNFTLAVTDLPIPTQPEPYRICDDLESGSDIDKKINTFLLNTIDDEIYGTLDKTQYNLTYHITQTGAETKDLSTIIPKNLNHTVDTSQTVYIRVENKDNTACYDASKTLELIVDPLPVIEANPELDQCIDSGNTDPTVNLTLAQNNISKTTNIAFEYYQDFAGTNQITDPTSYPVAVNTIQFVYVKVISEFNCARDLAELKINVGQTPDNAYADTQTAVCDDFLQADGTDGALNDDTDNITQFSLDKNTIETGINPPVNTEVFYYENLVDRTNSLNQIDITNFRNDITKNNITNIAGGIQFPIYYKILSTINNDCQGLGQFYLQINQVPKTSSENLSPIIQCDTGLLDGNFSNGSNTNIDLTQRIDDAIAGTSQNKNDFNFTFYKSEAAAISGDITNADYIANPDKFTNDVPASFTEGDIVTQPIFMRIENTASGCVNPHTSFNVIINPLPIITNIIPPVEVCDMGTKDGDLKNGLAQEIDVSIRDTDILGTRNAADFTISYHKTQTDLENLSSTGIDKNSYDSDPARVTINPTTNNSEESLFIRIINNNTKCAFNQTTLTIVVNPEPNIPATINNYSECDNATDTFGDDDNGINGDITLNNKIPEILANYTPAQYSNFNVTFYESSADASAGNLSVALDANLYQNTTNDQPIYVRVENIATTCVYDDLSFLINIKPKPSFMVMGEENIDDPLIVCLNNTPLTLMAESPAADYNYIWTDESGAEIGYTFDQNVSLPGKYTVTASDKFPDGCERKRTIVVEPSNIATLERSFVTIIDESNNISSTNNSSIFIDTLTNNLGPGDYRFAILNTDTNDRLPFAGFQEEPLFENLEGGVYTIIVHDENGCVEDTKLEVSVIQFPKFFTPNNDNKNDYWVIKGASDKFYRNASINIFNRFGKLVAQEQVDSQGWDGMYQGKLLPSDDYWYNIVLIPIDDTKPTINKKGNFSLLRK